MTSTKQKNSISNEQYNTRNAQKNQPSRQSQKNNEKNSHQKAKELTVSNQITGNSGT